MAKRRYETITLNGVRFTLDTKDVTSETSISRRDVSDCYGRPSLTKLAIFNEWSNWFLNNDGYCGVSSYNCNFFTIHGYVTDKETGKRYYCYITKAHNTCIEVA